MTFAFRDEDIASDYDVQLASQDNLENTVIKKINSDDELHKKILEKVLDRIRFSEEKMSAFYPRWNANELRLQAYINHPSKENELKEQNDSGEVPNAIRVVIPFGFAAASALVTYLLHTFTSRRPIFQLGTYKDESTKAARRMETVLQYQADECKLVKEFWRYFNDWVCYGFGAFRTTWDVEESMVTKRIRVFPEETGFEELNPEEEGEVESTRSLEITYEGNISQTIDPFGFFPDPRVPMHEVNRNGEFVFWRDYQCYVNLINMQRDGDLLGVDKVKRILPENVGDSSNRALLSRGLSHPARDVEDTIASVGDRPTGQPQDTEFVQIDQGTIKLIPKDWNIGDSKTAELWQIMVLNKDRIVQFEPIGADHNMHPVAVSEMFGTGYAFGALAPADLIGPLQDLASWLVNSHIENVRTHLNNMLVVDPSRIVMKDLITPGPGKFIRLKQTSLGTDVRTALHQLEIHDVTRSHLSDLELIMNIGMLILAVNEAAMGRPEPGNRATATERRIDAQAATSRLAAYARVCSAQGVTDLTRQWVKNTQQYLSDDFAISLLGAEGKELYVRADDLNGIFTYPVHDGSLPADKTALAGVWRDILQGVLKDEELRMQYDVAGIFETAAEIAGAKEIQTMRRSKMPVTNQAPQLLPDEMVARMAQQGNVVPIAGIGRNR